MMKDFNNEFPVTNEYIYLNTASCGLLSKSLVKWRSSHDENLLRGGSMFRDLHKAHIREIRADVARFFSTPEANIALVPNFSFGMNVLLDGLPKGQKILLLNGDYPSVNWPVEQRDFEVCYAEIDANLEANIEQAIAQHRPDVFAFSIVQYISGILIDFDFLKRLKAYHPEMLLITDATQFLGTTEFNFSESPIDVIGASSYKWLLSGYGNGFFMFSDLARQRIEPKTIGFNSADAAYSKREAIEFVGRFEPGHQDTLNFGSLGESIKFLENIGMDRIEDHLKKLCGKAKMVFAELGLLEDRVVARENYSTIFNLQGDEQLFQKLKENNIICSQRGKGIRVSFHFYNTEEDLEALVTCLKANQ